MSYSASNEAALSQRILQGRLDLAPNIFVCVSDPSDIRLNCKRSVQLSANLIADDNAELAGDQLGAQVIWVAANAQVHPAFFHYAGHQRPDVGDETVVADHEFVKLAARRDILVLETLGLA